MGGDVTINVEGNDEPVTEPEEGSEGWQSTLSEVVREGLASGFNQLREEFSSQMRTVQQQNSELLVSNTSLTSQIAETNRTLLERLPASIQPTTVVIPVVEETPLSDTPNPAEEETNLSEVELESQEPPPPTKRKRRTL